MHRHDIPKRAYLAVYACILLVLPLTPPSNALSHHQNRRAILTGIISSPFIPITASNSKATAAPVPPSNGALQGTGGTVTRVEGIGGGFDLTRSTVTPRTDVIYPTSLDGTWDCRRAVTSMDGDSGQATLAWRLLGGNDDTGSVTKVESFTTRFVRPPDGAAVNKKYTFDGRVYDGCVLDRGSEMEARKGCSVTSWAVDSPDVLAYDKEGSGRVEIAVVQRQSELPTDKGWGYNELYRITSSAGGVFGESRVVRGVRVQRRYRRSLDADGRRTVEGLEIMKTYRVLDGIAGVEMPTSTTKSQIRLSR